MWRMLPSRGVHPCKIYILFQRESHSTSRWNTPSSTIALATEMYTRTRDNCYKIDPSDQFHVRHTELHTYSPSHFSSAVACHTGASHVECRIKSDHLMKSPRFSPTTSPSIALYRCCGITEQKNIIVNTDGDGVFPMLGSYQPTATTNARRWCLFIKTYILEGGCVGAVGGSMDSSWCMTHEFTRRR